MKIKAELGEGITVYNERQLLTISNLLKQVGLSPGGKLQDMLGKETAIAFTFEKCGLMQIKIQEVRV